MRFVINHYETLYEWIKVEEENHGFKVVKIVGSNGVDYTECKRLDGDDVSGKTLAMHCEKDGKDKKYPLKVIDKNGMTEARRGCVIGSDDS